MSVSRRLAPSTRSSARAASSRATPSASSAARTARSVAASAFSASARRSAQAALFFEHGRRIGERSPLLLGLGAAGVERRDLGDGAVAAVAPGLPVGADGAEAAVGELGFARQGLRLGANLGELRALALDLGANGGELAFQIGGWRQLGKRAFGDTKAGLGFVPAGAEPGLGFGQGGDARGVACHLALSHSVQLACVVGLTLSAAPMLAGGGFGCACR